ncbi:Tim9-Tim10 complex subunit Tim9 [Schizosaccharomyces japonicus yFS275]|uniref:Mitochondrial import inner membrane translocase subunit n=1 Tax=Schizosaccharomyces japonicus (strain yFS275 / FY16936) TaxID=402676 RepID=B6K680_SCHJY|nr:Tim9-Tim10 complex subunit Tim9 [Schizosaccharomyces japonicus yFS275]EEB09034.1 Tim9-Tim10 complex subunit Tim9 [Schizosaccharomyces japonicus yFS275]
MERLNAKEQEALGQVLEAKQLKEYLRMYSTLTQNCFKDCVQDFTTNKLSKKEGECIIKCAEKFLKHSERVGQRFAEFNAKQMSS